MLEVTAAVIRKGDRFLICQRPEGKNCAMLWEFPGGKIEPGETGEDCIVRECAEELELPLRVIRKLTDVVMNYPEKTVHLHFYICEIRSGEPVLKEHNSCAWIRSDEVDGYSFCPADRKMLDSPAWQSFASSLALMNDEKICMSALRLAGLIIMQNGGETFRAEETVSLMGAGFGLTQVECFAVPSGLFISFMKRSGETETAVIRVREHTVDLDRVDRVNRISREVVAGKLDCRAALERLEKVDSAPAGIPRWLFLLASGLSAGGFTVMFHGTVTDFLISFVLGLLIWQLNLPLRRISPSRNLPTLFHSFFLSFACLLFCKLTGLGNPGTVIAGALMPLLPGLAMTNAVQDTVRGDMISGLSHAAQALLTATLIALGTLTASALSHLLFGMGGGVL